MRQTLFFIAALAVMVGTSTAQTTLAAPGTANNGGSPGWAMFFDLESLSGPLSVTHLQTASTAAAAAPFSIEVFTRSGSSLTGVGGSVASGPGSSSAGWTSLGIASAMQGATASGISDQVDIPDIAIGAGQTVGVALQFIGVGPRYLGTGTPPYSIFGDGTLQLTTGDSRSAPFTTGGSFFASRAPTGSATYVAVPEPAAFSLLAIAIMGFVGLRRR